MDDGVWTRKRRHGLVVSGTVEALTVRLDDDLKSLDWSQIAEVRAWAQDLITTDRICAVLTDSAGMEWVSNEEQPVFESLLEACQQRLPEIDLEPLARLRAHPFSREVPVLWRRR